MSEFFNIEGAERGIVSALAADFEKMPMSLTEAFEVNHVVMQWVFGQKTDVMVRIAKEKKATAETIAPLNDLWTLFEKHGVVLDEAEKVRLYQDFLDD